MNSTVLKIMLLVALGGMSGCSVTCDPSKGGLIDGLSCGKEYEKRLQDRQSRLDSLKALETQEQSKQQDLTKQRNKSKRQLAALEKAYNRMSSSLSGISKRLNTLKASGGSNEKKRKRLQAKASELKRKIANAKRELKAGRSSLEVYDSERSKLEGEIKRLADESSLLE